MTTADDQENAPGSAVDDASFQDWPDTTVPSDATWPDVVERLMRQVDDRVDNLEREAQKARDELAEAYGERERITGDPAAASSERFRLQSEVVGLQAQVSRQAAQLDERDAMLAELSNRIVTFERQLKAGTAAENDLAEARQSLFDERRELARVKALLEASAVERRELSEVAHRLHQENDHLDGLLVTARQRFEEVDKARVELGGKLAELESARDGEIHAHEMRAQELVDAQAEVRRLQADNERLSNERNEALHRIDRIESSVERRANEVGYLNRRIEALTGKADDAERLEIEVRDKAEQNELLQRRVGELERLVEAKTVEAAASAAAVEAIAERSADNDDLLARIAELEAQAPLPVPEPSAVDELHDLADRAMALGSRRAVEGDTPPSADLASIPFIAAPGAGPETQAVAPVEAPTSPESDAGAAQAPPAKSEGPAIAIPALEMPEVSGDPAAPAVEAPALELPGVPADDASPADAPTIEVPALELPAVDIPEPTAAAPTVEVPALELPAVEVPEAAEIAAPTVEIPTLDVPAVPEVVEPPSGSQPAADVPLAGASTTESAPDAGTELFGSIGSRRRLVLPADMQPDSVEAVDFLLRQPGVTAIIDARSFCGRTGIRPSALFGHLEELRDRFDVPVEVVVTPVSTPVGGAPDLPAIGVHSVSGAETVADRIRALCIGFPPDQQLVVVAGDDHTRRAAIAEEANVVDPIALADL